MGSQSDGILVLVTWATFTWRINYVSHMNYVSHVIQRNKCIKRKIVLSILSLVVGEYYFRESLSETSILPVSF